VTPVLEQAQAKDEAETIGRWREETGRNGRASSGWAATLEAASDGRVDLLLFQEGVDHAAFRCPACGRAAVAGGSCPLDGTSLERVDAGLDLAELARLLLSFGARDAINLDGGGSATLVHRGHLLNRPYSSVDQPAPESRPVVTALVFG
jgi:hypothetical protein